MSAVSGSVSNASPPPQNQQHTRTYQACIPCRRRKVRCDLGPVDNPHDPPCVRCRRESKECFFSATRRKRKTQDGVEEVDDDGADDDYEIRNARKRMRSGPPEPVVTNRVPEQQAYVSQPLTPGGSVGRYEPLRRPTLHSQSSNNDEEEDQTVNNQTAAILQTKEVYSGHDALNLLFEAAGRNGDMDHHRTGSASSLNRPVLGPVTTPGSQTAFASPQANATHGYGIGGHSQPRPIAEPVVDPVIVQQPRTLPEPPNEAAFAEAVQAWSRFRFVRAGWLTAKEAIQYIDYFYKFLSPLTPIVVPDYHEHNMHGKLLKEEPMLVVTLLTITTRFAHPGAPGGTSRAYEIHGKFWEYLQKMINRLLYGQEQFGGGFCGAGQQPGSDVNPLSRKGLRTLGTVESLMLLTEWHPRALHFPPGDDDDELVLPDDLWESINARNARADLVNSVGGQRIDSWLEPCWRSDRMCWMLLGNAMALAFEIGVFDDTSEAEFEEANRHLSEATVKAYFRRKNHLKTLLIIYQTQTSGRLGLTSMLPNMKRKIDVNQQRNPQIAYQDRISRIRIPPPNASMLPDGKRFPLESVTTQNKHAKQDLVLDFWGQIADIMEVGNLELFPNRRRTRELLKSGEYEIKLKEFQKPLIAWKMNFDRAQDVPQQLRHVLTIEYEYTRVYLNSLALQAVVERCTHNTPTLPNGFGSSKSKDRDGGAIPFSTLSRWYGNDRHYISEVIDASRTLLRVVVDGLSPEYLLHAPVRTFFRIVSVAIILLKTFALGATEDDVAYSLELLERAVDTLRTSIVDDVHVGNRFADLVAELTRRIRTRFVRLAANGSSGISRAGSRSPSRTGVHTPNLMPPPQFNQQGHLAAPFGGSYSDYRSGVSAPNSPGTMGVTASGRVTPNPYLEGISLHAYDPSSNAHTLMPPPQFGTNGYNDYMQQDVSYNNSGWERFMQGDQDWLALPLDPLLSQSNAEITQTAMGPDVGGMDMLDILLNLGPGSA